MRAQVESELKSHLTRIDSAMSKTSMNTMQALFILDMGQGLANPLA